MDAEETKHEKKKGCGVHGREEVVMAGKREIIINKNNKEKVAEAVKNV